MKKSIIKKITAIATCAAMIIPSFSNGISTYAAEYNTPQIEEEYGADVITASVVSTKTLSGYTWQHQSNTNWCWAATGSMLFSKVYSYNVTQEDVVYAAGKSGNVSGSLSDLSTALSYINYALDQSHTWSSYSPNSTAGLSQIKASLNNNRALALSTSYIRSNGTTAYHMVLCTGYRVMSANTTQLRIYDPAPTSSSSGIYWTGSYNSSNVGYSTSLYGDVHIISCGYAT